MGNDSGKASISGMKECDRNVKYLISVIDNFSLVVF